MLRSTTVLASAALVASAAMLMSLPATLAQEAGAGEARPEASPAGRVAALRAAQLAEGEGNRIFGGDEAEPGEFPFQVALLLAENLDDDPVSQFGAQFCGGSLITPEWVLTAAHCLVLYGDLLEPESLVVLTGATMIDEGTRHEVAEIVIHESYDDMNIQHDIGLIRLAAPAEEAPIAMADEDAESGTARVTGWGMMDDGFFPFNLMHTQVDLQTNAACNEGIKTIYARDLNLVLRYYGTRFRLDEATIDAVTSSIAATMADPLTGDMLCAGVPDGARDSCHGDSGGPLFLEGPDGARQVGIVSWGAGPIDADAACGHENAYGVYTRLSYYKDWIAEKTGL